MPGISTLFFVVAGVILAAFLHLRSILWICGPDQALVLYGLREKIENRTGGYQIVQGGRVWRIPAFEKAILLDLSSLRVELDLCCDSRDLVPLNVQVVAIIKIALEGTKAPAAVERFLGMSRGKMAQIVREVLEGGLHGVLATLTLVEISDEQNVLRQVMARAEKELHRLGLKLDSLVLSNINDDVGAFKAISAMRLSDPATGASAAPSDNGP